MAESHIGTFEISYPAAASMTGKAGHAAVISGSDVAVAGAGVAIAGVITENEAAAAGDMQCVRFKGKQTVIAGAAFVAGVQLETNANGRFIKLAAGIPVGYALTAASADGDEIQAIIY